MLGGLAGYLCRIFLLLGYVGCLDMLALQAAYVGYDAWLATLSVLNGKL